MGDSRSPQNSTAGTSLRVQSLYQSHTDEGHVHWLTEPPSPPASNSRPESGNPEYAITLRYRSFNGRRHTLDSIIIRSPPLRKFLDETIEHISALYDENEEGLVVQAPFRILFWHFEAIEKAAAASSDGQEDDALAAPALLLRSILDDEFRDLLQRRTTMVAQGQINFDTLWTLFKPGITCVTTFMEIHHIAVRCISIDFGRHAMGGMYYRIKFENLVWNGESLGWRDDYTDIMEFKGRRKIRDAHILPLEFWKGGSVEQLAARGRRFLDLVVMEPYMMRFSGESLDSENSPMWWQGEQKKKMSERVILDARAYSHYFRRLAVSKWRSRDQLTNLDQLQLAYVFPELHVFALQRKRWSRVWVDDVDEVVFNDAAYPSLVLPNDYKQLLLAFAEAQIDAASGVGGFDDVIAGKGQGILMLLAGPPGTGKTLTAEAMSEHMRLPLYSVSTGELGMAAAGMENELNKVLELSTRWNAVLLLDEADVFLERRADNDIQRNSIVSIFLRRLEYYRGIMFLTTNRIRSFDEAFRSRIHVAIQYPDLDTKARQSIWTNFLRRAKETYRYGVDFEEAQVEGLAELALNGREIRNIVKSAQLLASRSKESLKKKHVEIVWRVEMENSPWQKTSAG
jgi:cytidylate kinase